MSELDRIELEFTSDVTGEARLSIIEAIKDICTDFELYRYHSISKLNGATRIEIAAHDRTTIDYTDGQVVEKLRVVAKEQGMSVVELLRKLATDNV